MGGTPAKVRHIIERVSDALAQTETEIRSYIRTHPEFQEIGERMLEEWKEGRELSLRPA